MKGCQSSSWRAGALMIVHFPLIGKWKELVLSEWFMKRGLTSHNQLFIVSFNSSTAVMLADDFILHDDSKSRGSIKKILYSLKLHISLFLKLAKGKVQLKEKIWNFPDLV